MKSGEKMGFQITLLLTTVIYVEYMSSNIAVFDSVERTPNILKFFLINIGLLCLSLIGKCPLL